MTGTVYLIHFERKLAHAQHYIGWAESDFLDRLERHRAGCGAKILRACKAAGIRFHVVRTWDGVDRNFERKLKNRKSTPDLCPVCRMKRKVAK